MIINRNILLARRIDDKGEDRAALIRMDRNEKIDPFNKSIYTRIFKKISGILLRLDLTNKTHQQHRIH